MWATVQILIKVFFICLELEDYIKFDSGKLKVSKITLFQVVVVFNYNQNEVKGDVEQLNLCFITQGCQI